jgi:3-hydroxyisobutyrate dehydrogenase-like beta-hydroxyacid dehydrogenase
MKIKTIGVVGTGDMGSALGRSLISHDMKIVTSCNGRSLYSRNLAVKAGFEILESLSDVIEECDVFLSVVPPASANNLAKNVADAIRGVDRFPLYVDCNAISPASSKAIGDLISKVGSIYIDAGIVGPPPGLGATPRLYVCGPQARQLLALDSMGIKVNYLGDTIGHASGLKMIYSGLNKGFNALSLLCYSAAVKMGLTEELEKELHDSLSWMKKRIDEQLPYLPVNAERWIDEMREVGSCMQRLGLPPDFHSGAANMFELLNMTPYAAETRQTFNKKRAARDVAKACVEASTKGGEL